MKSKILCFIGWHRWAWKLRYAGFTRPIVLDTPPPNDAICEVCGKKYKGNN